MVIRKTSDVVLAEDELAVDDDIEDAAPARDELRLDLERILDLGRQTGGTGQIVSLLAVGDLDSHDHS